MQVDVKTFSEWVSSKLAAKEWTQKILAERLHTSESHLSFLLRGRRTLTADHCISIANVLDESPLAALAAAGLLPESATDPLLRELWRIACELSPEARRYVVAAMRGIRELGKG